MEKLVSRIFLLLTCFAVQLAFAETNDVATLVKRGEYLVENVAVCTDCHTERDWKGTLNREKWLRGNTLEFKPTRWMPWGPVAPDIAGLPQFKTDEEAITFFMTGKNAAGKEPRPPMQKAKLTREDAQAVVAYLRSLKPVTK